TEPCSSGSRTGTSLRKTLYLVSSFSFSRLFTILLMDFFFKSAIVSAENKSDFSNENSVCRSRIFSSITELDNDLFSWSNFFSSSVVSIFRWPISRLRVVLICRVSIHFGFNGCLELLAVYPAKRSHDNRNQYLVHSELSSVMTMGWKQDTD